MREKVQEYYDEWQVVTDRLQEVRVARTIQNVAAGGRGGGEKEEEGAGTSEVAAVGESKARDGDDNGVAAGGASDEEHTTLIRQQASFGWPRAACILDPLRATVTCNSPSDLLDAIDLLRQSKLLELVRIKNKYVSFQDG